MRSQLQYFEDCGIYNNQPGGQFGVVGPPQGGGYDSGLADLTPKKVNNN